MKNILLILIDDRGISTYPAVFQTAQELKKRNFNVTIVTRSLCDDINLKKYFDQYILIKKSHGKLSIILYIFKLIFKYKFDYVISYEPLDAIRSSIISLFNKKSTYIYYNLEIYEKNTNLKWISRIKYTVKKFMERIYCNNSKYFIIQDELRREISKKHGIYNPNTYFIPNSYYYDCDYSEKIYTRHRYSLIYSGGLEEWSIKELVENIKAIENVDITLSGWSRDKYIDKIKNELTLYKNIKINMENLDVEEYAKLISKHDIGLVWYSDKCDNVFNIGRSSGKYFMYLRCNKPVIVPNLQGIADDVRKYKLGEVISNLDELYCAVEKITSNYQKYVENIENVYPKIYDYGNCSKKFFDML